MNSDGSINQNGGKFNGMMRYDARMAIEVALKEKGLYKGKKSNTMRLAICSRSGDIVEPLITPQWYIKCDDMAKQAMESVQNGDLTIFPSEHKKTWFHWLGNIKDWCISRQLWWGHQIPAWFATTKEENIMDKHDISNNYRWIVARGEKEALHKASFILEHPVEDISLEREGDVLDTWFSSGLFPFATLGWPEPSADFEAFYPTSLLETGLDILFFWVARMVMMGLQLTGKLPFHTVYLHAMVRDKDGRKMSKSLGNVIDPLEVIHGCTLDSLLEKLDNGNLPDKEVRKAKQDLTNDFPDGISECGSDALRFGLLAYTVQGRDVNLDIKRVVGYRNFCNKLWNATRFALQFVSDFKPTINLLDDVMSSGKMAPRDQFIISRLMQVCQNINEQFQSYKFGEAQQSSYSFWINDLCDVYLELIKPIVYDKSDMNKNSRWAAQACLWLCIEMGLRILHPMMPFVTEELWQRLPGRGSLGDKESDTIMHTSYPHCIVSYVNLEAEASIETALKVIKSCRSLRSSYSILNKVLTKFYLKISDKEDHVYSHMKDIMTLGKASNFEVNTVEVYLPKTVGIDVVDDQTTLFMDLKGLVNYELEIQKLEKVLSKTIPQITNLERKINSKGYENNVPEELKNKNKNKLTSLQKKLNDINDAIEKFQKIHIK